MLNCKEFETSYFPLEYVKEKAGLSIFSAKLSTFNPEPESLLMNTEFKAHLKTMGRDGWEMAAITPALRSIQIEPAHAPFTVTAGYFIFWQRFIQTN